MKAFKLAQNIYDKNEVFREAIVQEKFVIFCGRQREP